jgi:hypothetical protein
VVHGVSFFDLIPASGSRGGRFYFFISLTSEETEGRSEASATLGSMGIWNDPQLAIWQKRLIACSHDTLIG